MSVQSYHEKKNRKKKKITKTEGWVADVILHDTREPDSVFKRKGEGKKRKFPPKTGQVLNMETLLFGCRGKSFFKVERRKESVTGFL